MGLCNEYPKIITYYSTLVFCQTYVQIPSATTSGASSDVRENSFYCTCFLFVCFSCLLATIVARTERSELRRVFMLPGMEKC